MSYNNIGLVTPRGSGTNGYIQRNLAALHKKQFGNLFRKPTVEVKPISARKPNKDIIEHERKRKIEVLCFEKREELEAKKIPEEKILKELSSIRKKHENSTLELYNLEKLDGQLRTHENTIAAAERDKRLREAFAIPSNHVHGSVFDIEELRRVKEQANIEKRNNMSIEERIQLKKSSFLDRVTPSTVRPNRIDSFERDETDSKRNRLVNEEKKREKNYRKTSISRSPKRRKYGRSNSEKHARRDKHHKSSHKIEEKSQFDDELNEYNRKNSIRNKSRKNGDKHASRSSHKSSSRKRNKREEISSDSNSSSSENFSA